MKLTDTELVERNILDIHIYDKCCLAREYKRVFVVRTYNVTTDRMMSFIVHFDPDNPSSIMRSYLSVHWRKSWNDMTAHAKKCLSMYGYFDVEEDDFCVVSLLVTDRVNEYVEKSC